LRQPTKLENLINGNGKQTPIHLRSLRCSLDYFRLFGRLLKKKDTVGLQNFIQVINPVIVGDNFVKKLVRIILMNRYSRAERDLGLSRLNTERLVVNDQDSLLLNIATNNLVKAYQKSIKQAGSLKLEITELPGISKYWMMHFKSWKGNYAYIPMREPQVKAVLSTCTNQSTRKKVYDTFMQNYSKSCLTEGWEILNIRNKVAASQGYNSWLDIERAALGICNLKDFWQELDTAVHSLKIASNLLRTFESSDDLISSTSYLDEHEAIRERLPANLNVVNRIMKIMGNVFGVLLRPVFGDISGWSTSVAIYELLDDDRTIGYLYIDLWGTESLKLAGATRIAPGHVIINMNFQKGNILESRHFELSEVAAIMHEVAHGIQMNMVQWESWNFQPLDMVEFPSVFAETLCYHKETIKELTGLTLKKDFNRSILDYLRISRGASIYSISNSKCFKSPDDFQKALLIAAVNSWPTKLPHNFNGLVGDPSGCFDVLTWLRSSSPQSKLGYLRSYARAHSIILKYGAQHILKGNSSSFFKNILQIKVPEGSPLKIKYYSHPFHNLDDLKVDYSIFNRVFS
jgi:Peptidase family M3